MSKKVVVSVSRGRYVHIDRLTKRTLHEETEREFERLKGLRKQFKRITIECIDGDKYYLEYDE